jgi:hypothetical protein
MLSATDNNDVTTYFLQDGLGSTTGLTDDSGDVAALLPVALETAATRAS